MVAFVVAPALATGPGVRAGDFELHVGGDTGVSFDDNFFRKSEASAFSEPEAVSALVAGIKLTAENRSPNKVYLKLRGDVDFRKTLGAAEESKAAQRDGISAVTQGLTVGLLPRSSFSVDLNERLTFHDQPAEFGADEGLERLVFEIGPDLRFRPGAGASKAFELRLGYRFKGTRFLNKGSAEHESDGHELKFLTEWRFFPKTVAFADVRYSVIDRPEQDDDDEITQDRLRNVDANPFRLELGVRGLITQRLSAVLRAGFMHTFNAELDSFVGAIGKASLEYIIEPTFQIEGGYEYDAKGSAFSNFYKYHSAFAGTQLSLLGRVTVKGKVAYVLKDYTQSNARVGADNTPTAKRDDPFLRVDAGIGYHFVDWVDLSVRWRLERNDTDFTLRTRKPGEPGQPSTIESEPRDYAQQIFSFLLTVDY